MTLQEIVRQILIVRSAERVVDYALRHVGWGNSDIGAGVQYADPDDFDVSHIPPGHVEIYIGWGAPEGYDTVVTESEYLRILAMLLREQGMPQAADALETLRSSIG